MIYKEIYNEKMDILYEKGSIICEENLFSIKVKKENT